MAGDKPGDTSGSLAESPGEQSSSPLSPPSRLQSFITRELRRFLDTPREHSKRQKPLAPAAIGSELEDPNAEARDPAQLGTPLRARPIVERSQDKSLEEEPPEGEGGEESRESMHRTKKRHFFGCRLGRAPFQEGEYVIVDKKSARVSAMEQASLIVGAILVLGLTFYVGKKFAYWKYLIAMRNTPVLSDDSSDKFPGVSSEELLEQGFVTERSGKWQDAVKQLMAAKRKNHTLPGILYHIGNLLFEHNSFDAADEAFKNAIAFGEDIDTASYSRGVIATRRRNLPAAERFFETAASAKPAVANYYFHWAEVLRLDSHPREAIPRYEQAARRTRNAQDDRVHAFKIRITEGEAGGSAKVKRELDEKRRAGPLPVDWLMTAAALKIRENLIDDAVQLLTSARSGNDSALFAACVQDMCFQDASALYPEVASVCKLALDRPAKVP